MEVEKIRVIYVLNATTLFGGANKSFLAMLQQLRQKGVEPVVVVPDNDGIYALLLDMGIETLVLDYRTATYPPVAGLADLVLFVPRLCGRLCLNHRAARQLAQVCRDKKIDLIHTNVSVVDIGYRAARSVDIPHLWHIREYGLLDFGYRYIWSRGQQLKRYKQPRSYTACITKDILRYNDLANHPQACVIYNGIAPAVSQPSSTTETSFFLYAGRIEQGKGVAELVDAYADYCRRVDAPLPLYLVGKVSDRDFVEKIDTQLKKEGLKNGGEVLFVGEKDSIASFYTAAKAVIVPSHHEGFGRVVAEAMSYGAPVIGKDTAGIKEQFDNGLTLTGEEIGLRYTTQDELTRHLMAVTQNPEQTWSSMTERAKTTVRKLYSVETNAEQVFALYRNMLRR